MKNNCTVELVLNPCCLCERDYLVLGRICERYMVLLTVFNLWEIDDETVGLLPAYISQLITARRNGVIAGSLYSDVFINGRHIPLVDWPDWQNRFEQAIVAAGGSPCR